VRGLTAARQLSRVLSRAPLARSVCPPQTSAASPGGEPKIAKLVDVLKEVAQMNRSIGVAEQRQIDTDRRFTALEGDFRELHKGNGRITHQRASAEGQY
jgi:hypothetical protein